MAEIRLIDANALKEALHNFFDGKVIDEPVYILHDVFCHIDNAPTILQNEDKKCKTCKYYLYAFEGHPCINCCRNFKLVDEIREQQNDRWKDGTPNG